MAHSRRSRPHDFSSSKELGSMEKQILKYLHDHYRSANGSHETLDIARGVGKKTKHDINKFLYILQKKGYVEKTVESPPAWRLLHYEQSVHSSQQHGDSWFVPNPASFSAPPGTSNPQETEPKVISVQSLPDESTFIQETTPKTVSVQPLPTKSFPNPQETTPKAVQDELLSDESLNQEEDSATVGRLEPVGQSMPSEFVIPPPPDVLLKDATSAFYNVSLKENIPIENVEKEVLRILNSYNEKLETEMILGRVARYGSDAVLQALQDLEEKNLIQKEGNYYFNNNAAEYTVPKSHYYQSNPYPSFGPGKAFVRHDFTEDVPINFSFASSSTSTNHIFSSPPPVLRLPEGKNAISVLNEYAQGKQWRIGYKEHISGPDHMRRFSMTIQMGGQSFQGQEAATKKDAKLKAAEAALAELFHTGKIETAVGLSAPIYSVSEQREASIHDKVAALVIQKYNELSLLLPDNITGKKIIAGFVMSRKLKSGEISMQVVSIGSGNRCVKGDKLSLRGETVNDCHAEIIARRGLIRYFYRELLTGGDSKFVLEADKYALIPDVKFHLYISTAPCGDSAIFAPSDITTDQPGQDKEDGEHHPLFENKKQGLLRTKVESGEGCIPVEEDTAPPTWDGILRGERLRTMSCSDKIAKWNFLGLQGSLLSHFLKPIYLSTLTLGMLYNHGHLTRAVCCRVQRFMETLDKDLEPPTAYTVNHPDVGTCSQNHNRETGKLKTREFSVNWSLGDERPEVLDGTEGKCESRFGSTNPPQICKAEIYKEFKKLCTKADQGDLHKESYYKSKMAATEYQNAKNTFRYVFEKNGYGMWMPKPKEEKDF